MTTEHKYRLYSAAELAAYQEPELARYSDGKCPSFDLLAPNDFWYEIPAHRCDTAPKLVEWLRHLSDKTWFSIGHTRQLIRLVDKRYPGVCEYGC